MPSQAEEATLEAARAVVAESPLEAEETPSDPEDAAALEVQEADAEFELDPELPEDIAELVDTPDFEAEAEAELAEVEDEDEDVYEDPDTAALRKQLRAAEKERDHYKNIRLTQDRKKWVEEAEKFFPLSDPEQITADSRRGFLRAAKAEHEARKPLVEKVIAPRLAALEAERETIRAEVRAELEAAWGKPTVSPGPVPTLAQDKAEEVDRRFQEKGLAAGIKAMLLEGGDK